ncbi:MAG: YIP1 family protein [Myxococcaceae bacterium]|nr:YIP1 family protein [Myxococcaceae bacterium]
MDGVPAAVSSSRWAVPLVMVALATALSGAAFALRWDSAPSVVTELQQSGELTRLTEQEILEKIQVASRTQLVGGVAKGVFVIPFFVLAVAALLAAAGWLFGARGRFAQLFTASAVAFLPVGLYHLLFAVCALRQNGLSEAQAKVLLPSHLGAFLTASPKLASALAMADFFNVWSVVLLGLGFSAATGMRKGRALLLCAVMFAMYVGVFLVGLPGMSGGRS